MPLNVFYINQKLHPELISVTLDQADFIYCDIASLNEQNVNTKPILLTIDDPLISIDLLNANLYHWIDPKTLDLQEINDLKQRAHQLEISNLTHKKLSQSIKELEYQIEIQQKDLLFLQEQKKINRFEVINLQQQYHFFYEFIQEVEDTETLPELLKKLTKFFQRHTGINQCGLIHKINQHSNLIITLNNSVETVQIDSVMQDYHLDDLYFYDNRLNEVNKLIDPIVDFIHLMPLKISPEESLYFVLSGRLKANEHYSWLLNLQSLLKTKIQSLTLLKNIKKNSLIWKSAFNQLGLAVAIVDQNQKIVLANTHYQIDLHEELKKQSQLTQLQGEISFKEHLYHFEIIEIILSDQTPFKVILLDNIREEREKFNQFLQKQKLELMARLSDRIAHDLLNPIGGIKSITELLLSEPNISDSSTYQDDLKQIQLATHRAIDIIRSLQDFTKPQEIEHASLDLRDEIKKSMVFAKSLTRYINVKTNLPDIPLLVNVQKDLFQQIIFNLIQNAVQAMNQKGQLLIHVTHNLQTVTILVQDSGPGIPTKLRETVFAPLFTTKKLGEGTGLGLAFVKGVIEQWGGSITLQDPLPEFTGACFVITLPLSTKGFHEN